MLISLPKDELSFCLDTVEKALPTRSSVQPIENILLECRDQWLTFTATNLEQDISVKIPYAQDGSGSILLPPRIVDIVRYLPAAEVKIEINWDKLRLDIESGQSNYVLFGADPADFPSIQTEGEPGSVLSLEQADFKKILKKVVFAASTDESRPAFNGVLLSFKDQQVALTASDTYRLVVQDLKDESWSFEEQRWLIPAKALRELLKIMGEDGEITISPGPKRVIFRFDNVYFATRVLEEKYPDVRGVIPTAFKTRILIKKKLLEESVVRAGLLAEGINQAIHFSIHDHKFEVKVSSQIGKMEEMLQCSQEGEDIDIFVNARFVMDILKVLEQKEILIDFHGKNGPLVFKIPGDDAYIYLVLPIKME